jgi:hypothetical protein
MGSFHSKEDAVAWVYAFPRRTKDIRMPLQLLVMSSVHSKEDAIKWVYALPRRTKDTRIPPPHTLYPPLHSKEDAMVEWRTEAFSPSG